MDDIEELKKEMAVLKYFEKAKYGCATPAQAEDDLGIEKDKIETILIRNGVHVDVTYERDVYSTDEKEVRDAIEKLEKRIIRLKDEKEKEGFINRWFGGRDKIIGHIIAFFSGLLIGLILT